MTFAADTVVCLPTGGGKTLIYALPAAMKATGITVVLCPLIALMNDQKRREWLGSYRQRNVAAFVLRNWQA